MRPPSPSDTNLLRPLPNEGGGRRCEILECEIMWLTRASAHFRQHTDTINGHTETMKTQTGVAYLINVEGCNYTLYT